MKRILFVLVLILLAGCGGSKIQLNNGTGMDLSSVTLSIAGNSETWNDIKADQTFGSDIPLPDEASNMLLEWEAGEEEWTMEYATIDSASLADRVSILFADGEISVNYSF